MEAILTGVLSGVGASIVTGALMAVLNKLRIMPELKALAAGQDELAEAIGSVGTEVGTVSTTLKADLTIEILKAASTLEEHLREELRDRDARLHAVLLAQQETLARHLESHAA